MGEVFPMPRLGDVFDDLRDNGRTMRISCHADRDAVVVSLWHDTRCRGSFRLAAGDLDRFIAALTEMSASLRAAPVVAEQSVGSGPTGRESSPAPASGTGTAPAEPPVEQTGDIAGSAGFGRLPFMPVPRVA